MTQAQVLLEIAALAAGALGRHVAPGVTRAARTARPKKRKAEVAVKLPAFGVDYAAGPISTRSLTRAGVKWVGRYVSPDPAKNLTRRESFALAHAGIRRVLVWESTANRALDGHDAGLEDAHQAVEQARNVGAPPLVVIYFAIDFDSPGPDVAAYFTAVRSVLGVERTGAYGGFTALAWLRAHDLIAHAWQTYAWSDGRWLPDLDLAQVDNGRMLDSHAVDFDKALLETCGWW